MKIVLITRDRPELTAQTIRTMRENASNWGHHNLLVIFDGTKQEGWKFTEMEVELAKSHGDWLATDKQLGVGGAKNLGISMLAEMTFMKDDDIIAFSDNDMYYLPSWDALLEYELVEGRSVQVGGWRHPYHQDPIDAVTGNCFVMFYSDWLKYGPFDSNALGPGQSEDFALSQKIKQAGEVITTLDPPVAIHCGLVNCEGKPATGWEQMAVLAEKQIKENNIDKIWLAVPDEGTILLERTANSGIKEFCGLNVGSGQRRFDNACGWLNIDCVSRPPTQVPDKVVDATKLVESFGEGTQDMVVLHHVLEHFGCGEGDEILRQCFGVLKPGGSLLVFVPDLRKLAGRWLAGELDDFSYMVNVYGAYQGLDGDRHKWGYDVKTLYEYLRKIPGTGQIKLFDWRIIPGADIAKDWWILGMEIVKG